MSKQDIKPPDPLDNLLASTFEQALCGPGNPLLVEQVLARIARQQRQRTLVLALCGLGAMMLCMLSAAPLLDLLPSLFTETFTSAAFTGELTLPVALVAAAIAIAGGWLLIEEATI